MVTFALIPMFGILGLVVDFGYMHFVKMSAQTAAEAAAQAAIISYHETVGASNPACGDTGVVCSTDPADCASNITTPTNPIEHGCMYAQNHGFNSTNQRVTYQAGVGSAPPTAPGIGTPAYWVTFRVIQRVPQLFSAVLGNASGLVAARSTAAVIGASDCIYALNPTCLRRVVGGWDVQSGLELRRLCEQQQRVWDLNQRDWRHPDCSGVRRGWRCLHPEPLNSRRHHGRFPSVRSARRTARARLGAIYLRSHRHLLVQQRHRLVTQAFTAGESTWEMRPSLSAPGRTSWWAAD